MRKLIFLILIGIFISNSSFAEIGPAATKKERLERESREFGRRVDNDAYLKIHESFLKENYAEVDRLSKDYLLSASNKPNTEDVLYLEALSLIKLNRGNEARIKFRELENSFTSSDRKASASASIADSYYYQGDLENAMTSYQETLKKYPSSDQTTYATYKFREISSKLGRPLRQQALEEAPFFTIQVGSFSKIRNANLLIRKLSGLHYEAYSEKDSSSGMIRVRVGRYTSRLEASATESRLKKDGYPTKIYP